MFDVPCKICGTTITEASQKQDDASVISVAQMKDAKRFVYGLAGEFEFVEDLGLQEGDSVCLKCMNEREHKPYEGVQCSSCGSKFRSIGHGLAWDCAGFVCRDSGENPYNEGKPFIACGFGSNYDMTKFPFKETPDNFAEGDTVCDACVSSLLASGVVTRDDSFWKNLADRSPDGQAASVPLRIPLPQNKTAENEAANPL